MALLVVSACQNTNFFGEGDPEFDPDFNKYVDNVILVEKGSDYVIYEYKDVRVDEIAAIAALYCYEQGNKLARLTNIDLYKNNSRRAYFMCDNQS